MRISRRFVVVTANLHVVSKHQVDGVRGIVRYVWRRFLRRPHVIGCQEGIQLQQADRVGRLQVVTTHRRDPHDNTNIVLLRMRDKVTASLWHFGAPPFGNALNHHRRHWHEVQFIHKRRNHAHIDGHLSVLPHNVRGRPGPGVQQSHADMAKAMADRADALRGSGYIVSVTADGNVGDSWPYALANVLTARGYIVVRNGVDLVAMHRTQAKLRRSVLVPKSVTFSDHEAVAVEWVLL